MLEKIKNYSKYPIWQHLRDIRFLGFMVFGVVVLLASWSGVNVIETNFELQKQIAQLDQQNKVQQLTNANLKLQDEYYNTDTYLELTARKQLGKGSPGEKLLLVPSDVALAHAKQLPEKKPAAQSRAGSAKPVYRQNLDAWLSFFFRRGSS
ncbi:MAG TPA: septum formation initiator family protein [Candidatus Saccharimonadales bacterium]|nr:septum formation initiator family protein [Candidatus Saccharimonadales bacterium]